MYEELIKALHNVSEYDSGYAKLMHDAADAIDELQKQRDEWESHAALAESFARGWIPVTERLPKEQETVLTWGEQGIILLNWRHDNKWCGCLGDVTHWMPLPEPPNEE